MIPTLTFRRNHTLFLRVPDRYSLYYSRNNEIGCNINRYNVTDVNLAIGCKFFDHKTISIGVKFDGENIF